jgi:hypothetical protein
MRRSAIGGIWSRDRRVDQDKKPLAGRPVQATFDLHRIRQPE